MTEASLAKIAITKVADGDLDRMVVTANDGFTGGRVTKGDLASWIIQYFAAHSMDSCLKKIRDDHFDKIVYLETLVKKLKASGQDELNADDLSALQVVIGQQGGGKKKPKIEAKQDSLPEVATS